MTPERIARALARRFPAVKAVSLFGSYGYGYNDRHTDDLDITAFADSIPEKKERKKALKPVVRKWKTVYDIHPFVDVFDSGKFKDCCIWWIETKTLKGWVEDFRKGDKGVHSELVDYIYRAKILYDPEGLLKYIKATMKDYPQKVREGEISGRLTAIFRLTKGNTVGKENARGNMNYLNWKLAQEIQSLQAIVYALNKQYWSSSKWSFRDYEKFKILPDDYLKELEILNGHEGVSFHEKIQTLDHLAEEILKIAKKEVPGARVRTRF